MRETSLNTCVRTTVNSKRNLTNNLQNMTTNKFLCGVAASLTAFAMLSCKPQAPERAAIGDAASRVYVAPGEYDEFYNIVSGGFNGQLSIYGIPSGRLIKILPVFSVHPENGWGYSEETKPMLNTSHGFVPWDDLHHVAISTTNGEHDGRCRTVGSRHRRCGLRDRQRDRHHGDRWHRRSRLGGPLEVLPLVAASN